MRRREGERGREKGKGMEGGREQKSLKISFYYLSYVCPYL